jgi:hypothetical protein
MRIPPVGNLTIADLSSGRVDDETNKFHAQSTGRSCSSIYFRNWSTVTPPHEAIKYPLVHNTSFQETLFTSATNSLRRYRLDTVLRLLISLLGSVCGVYWSSKCTWSRSPLNSTNRPSHFSIKALNISSSRVSIASVRTGRRYLVVNTKWHLRSETPLALWIKSQLIRLTLNIRHWYDNTAWVFSMVGEPDRKDSANSSSNATTL